MLSKNSRHIEKEEITLEKELIEAAKKNPAAFAVLYKKYYVQIFSFIYQRLDNKNLAADICSQVFLNAMLNLQKYTYKGLPFSSWLYRIALSELMQLFRKNKNMRTLNIESENLHQLAEEMEEEDNFSEYRTQLLQIISALVEDELQLVEMRYFEKRPFREIAEIMQITEVNAKAKIYRLLDKMKKKLTAKTGNKL